MFVFGLLSIFCLVQSALALSIMVPLYVYPGDSASAWSGLMKVIAAHPRLTFEIIINPDSGPGADDLPDSNYQYGIALLNKYSNVKLVGYVDTDYTARDLVDVEADVATYAGWGASQSNLTLDGIFFDEVSVTNNSANHLYLQAASVTVKSYFTSSANIVLNPGCVTDKTFYSYATTIIEYEGELDDFSMVTTIPSLTAGTHGNTGILMYDATPNTAFALKALKYYYAQNIQYVYATSDCCYNVLNTTLLSMMATTLATVIYG